MALEERSRPYETMIRHNPDGSIGAHHKRITEILRDGAVISANVEAAVSLAVAEGQDGLKLSEVLGEALPIALLQIDKLQSEVASLRADLTKVQDEGASTRGQATSSKNGAGE
ncbi:hypothetical protein SB18R_03210 [Pseudomonas oryzihabitans]|nr:hypothetical protein SB9_12445 [Pseudomonas psychrotolerans]KTT78256.1 hypothetical protein SB18R_03210 [Pseudomonas psychrotolerans]